MTEQKLIPCPFCGGSLELSIYDDTMSRFCDGEPCWKGGATCAECGIGIDVGTFMGGGLIEEIEQYIVEKINTRPEPRWQAREEWEASGKDGPVWVCIPDSVFENVLPDTYSDGKFSETKEKVFITHVMPRQAKPEPPKQEL